MGGAVFVVKGGSLTIDGNGTISGGSATVARAAAAAPARALFGSGFFLQGGGTLTFQPGAGQTQTIADVIADQTGSGGTGANAGSYSVVLSGAGTLILNAVNTYSGTTTVSAGTLGGTGTIGALAVNSGGTLAPGASAGTFHTGTITFSSGATFAAEIGGTGAGQYDQVDVHAGVNLGGATLSLSFLGGFSPSPGSSFVLIQNDGNDVVTGQFAQGTSVSVGGTTFSINYAGGDGNDVELTVPNNPPVASAVSTSGSEDGARVAITLGGSDPDAGDAVDSFTLATLPSNGQLFAASTGGSALTAGAVIPASLNAATIYFQPTADWNGATSFTYTASDGVADSAAATASITVMAVADIVANSVTVAQDSGANNSTSWRTTRSRIRHARSRRSARRRTAAQRSTTTARPAMRPTISSCTRRPRATAGPTRSPTR